MAAEPGTAPVAPPSGAGGGGGAQVLQQIEELLMQLLQSEPEPEIQQAVQDIQKQVEALQPIIGKDQAQEMQSGLANPAGAGAESGEGGGSQPEPGGAAPGGGGGGEPTHEVEIHIRPASKSFAGAKKAAMATHAERGHFSQQSPPGQTPTTEKQRQKARG